MTTAPMNGNETPVTRAELKEELARFKTELKTELKTERAEEFAQFKSELKTELYGDMAGLMNHVVEHLTGQMNKLRDDLTYQIANAARVAAEEHRRELAIVDEKYRDIPGRIGLVERELDEHRRDPRAHGARPRAPKRRPRS